MADKSRFRTEYLGNPNLPTPNVEFEYTPEQIKEIAKCKDDIIYFAENYFYIQTEDGKQKIELYKYQKRILKASQKTRMLCVLASRQVGKTTIMTIYSLWYSLFNTDKNILIVANREDTAIMILRRIRMAYEQMPNWLKAGIKKWGETEVLFANDSQITISTTTASSGVGRTIHILIIDETARIPIHLEKDFFEAVVPVISAGKKTKIFMVSTPFGARGRFYEIYTKCERGELPDWHHERIDWWEIPGRNDKWKQQMISALGSKKAFDQEFGNCFLTDEETAIDTTILEEMKMLAKEPKFILDDGCYKIWEEPTDGHIYVMGVDVAEGVGRANSVMHILDLTDLTNIKYCATYANNKIDPNFFATKLIEIAHQWGNPYMIIERNASGGQVIDALRITHGYENLITHLPQGQQSDGIRLGVYSHTSLKYKAVANMRYWVNTMKVLNIPDITTIQELETFVRQTNNTWRKKTGDESTDDRVMALVWGLFALENELCEKYFEIEALDKQGKPLKINHFYPNQFKIDLSNNVSLSNNKPLPTMFGPIKTNQIIQKNGGFIPYDKEDDEEREFGLADYQQRGWKPLNNT
jgi:hypothetical protein